MLTRALLGFSGLLAAIFSDPASAQTVTLRYNNWVPPTYFMHAKGLYKYFDEIKKVTEGRVVVEPSANALGPVPRNFQLTVDENRRRRLGHPRIYARDLSLE